MLGRTVVSETALGVVDNLGFRADSGEVLDAVAKVPGFGLG